MFFAYDIMLFCRTSLQEWAGLNQILHGYELASGEQLNRQKTSLFFNTNTKQLTRNYLMEVAGLRASTNMEKYLELPSFIGRSNLGNFKALLKQSAREFRIERTSFCHRLGRRF